MTVFVYSQINTLPLVNNFAGVSQSQPHYNPSTSHQDTHNYTAPYTTMKLEKTNYLQVQNLYRIGTI